jgi:O-methyltransferase
VFCERGRKTGFFRGRYQFRLPARDVVVAKPRAVVELFTAVYRSAKDVFDWVWPRLEPGGMVVFDDYGFPACPGVTKFVDEQRLLGDRTVIHNLNGHGLVVKR